MSFGNTSDDEPVVGDVRVWRKAFTEVNHQWSFMFFFEAITRGDTPDMMIFMAKRDVRSPRGLYLYARDFCNGYHGKFPQWKLQISSVRPEYRTEHKFNALYTVTQFTVYNPSIGMKHTGTIDLANCDGAEEVAGLHPVSLALQELNIALSEKEMSKFLDEYYSHQEPNSDDEKQEDEEEVD